MLQQTQVKTVLGYWPRWMRALPNVGALARASQPRLHKLWEGLGYYSRVRNLQKAARMILSKHGGRFPQAFDDILELPGIGRYTAGAICSIAFNQPTTILDGNVSRVLSRLFAIRGDPRSKHTNAELWRLAENLVRQAAKLDSTLRPPSRFTFHVSRVTHHGSRIPPSARSCSFLNQSLMELGALICTPREPKCGSCPVSASCAALRLGQVGDFPQLAKRPLSIARRFAAFVAERRGRLLVRRRPAGVVNGHLWEFPNVEIPAGQGSLKQAARAALGWTPHQPEPFCRIKHSITRYRMSLEVYRATPSASSGELGKGRWLTLTQLDRLAFCSAHRKVLEKLKLEQPRRA